VPRSEGEERSVDSALVTALADLEEEQALAIVRQRLDARDDPLELFEDTRRAMEIVGARFAEREYFIPELVGTDAMSAVDLAKAWGGLRAVHLGPLAVAISTTIWLLRRGFSCPIARCAGGQRRPWFVLAHLP